MQPSPICLVLTVLRQFAKRTRPGVRLLLVAGMSLFAGSAIGAETVSVTTLYRFAHSGDSSDFRAALVAGDDGNFYGTSYTGGAYGDGTFFRMTPAGVLTTLHSFSYAVDGRHPKTELIRGSDGNFYGTTGTGGDGGYGNVFKATSAGVVTTLFSFTGRRDGREPGKLVLTSDGSLYGTTLGDFNGNGGYGTIFKLGPEGEFTLLYTFTNDGNGAIPTPGLIQGSDGNFYGTTSGSNGASPGNFGTVYRITPAGELTTLYQFTITDDGVYPLCGLIQGADGNFYGTTPQGVYSGNGTVFRITPTGTLTTLHKFTGGSSDGDDPLSKPIQGLDGNFYGTTYHGGPTGYGTIYKLTPAGEFTMLHAFAFDGSGYYPAAALVQGSDGSFYGNTVYDGVNGNTEGGVIFKLTVSDHPAFFTGEVALSQGVYYLAFPGNGNIFGYYSYLSDPHFIYHFDLGYEYVFDTTDGSGGVFFYDFASGDFFYTSPKFAFPYLYDFTLQSVLYYYPDPDPNRAGRYNTNGIRYFYDYSAGKNITR